MAAAGAETASCSSSRRREAERLTTPSRHCEKPLQPPGLSHQTLCTSPSHAAASWKPARSAHRAHVARSPRSVARASHCDGLARSECRSMWRTVAGGSGGARTDSHAPKAAAWSFMMTTRMVLPRSPAAPFAHAKAANFSRCAGASAPPRDNAVRSNSGHYVRSRTMSADLYWPPRPWRAWLPELVFAGVFGLVFLPFALGLPLAALLESLLFAGVRTWRRLRSCGWSRYRRRPGSCRVAVIGAGWSGLAIAARLRELGVPFDGFEADDDVGGTWHPSRRYADLTMHAPAYGATFAGFPWPSPDERPTGEQVHAYMRSFAESKDLLRSYSFSTAVSGVDYSLYSRTATLTVNRRGGRGEEKEASAGEAQSAQQAEVGPFDLVIFASLAAQPAVPSIPGDFQGRSCHSSQATPETLAAIAERGERVVVVGAGKSSCDVVLALRRAGVAAEKLTWLVRRPYHFLKYERCLSRRSAQLEGSVWPRLRSCVALVALYVASVLPGLAWGAMWSLDFAYTPHDSTQSDGPPSEGTPS